MAGNTAIADVVSKPSNTSAAGRWDVKDRYCAGVRYRGAEPSTHGSCNGRSRARGDQGSGNLGGEPVTERFDLVPSLLADLANQHLADPSCAYVVRDLVGHSRLLVDAREVPEAAGAVAPLTVAVEAERGHFAPYLASPSVLAIEDEIDALAVAGGIETELRGVRFIDRTALGDDWVRRLLCRRRPCGATGRVLRHQRRCRPTTASIAFAIEAARRGRRVLLVDLDLESPGLGPTLLGDAGIDLGIVDLLHGVHSWRNARAIAFGRSNPARTHRA